MTIERKIPLLGGLRYQFNNEVLKKEKPLEFSQDPSIRTSTKGFAGGLYILNLGYGINNSI